METVSIRAKQGYRGEEWRRGVIYFPVDSVWSVSIASESVETEPQGCNHFRSDPGVWGADVLTLIGSASTWPLSPAPWTDLWVETQLVLVTTQGKDGTWSSLTCLISNNEIARKKETESMSWAGILFFLQMRGWLEDCSWKPYKRGIRDQACPCPAPWCWARYWPLGRV